MALRDISHLTEEERTEKRNEYGCNVLVMFHPFREICDLKTEQETWWDAFQARKDYFVTEEIEQTLNNMQDFHSAFCRNSETANNHLHDDADRLSDTLTDDEAVVRTEDDYDALETLVIQDAEDEHHSRLNNETHNFPLYVREIVEHQQSPLRRQADAATCPRIQVADAEAAVQLLRTGTTQNNSTVSDHSHPSPPLSTPSGNNESGTTFWQHITPDATVYLLEQLEQIGRAHV